MSSSSPSLPDLLLFAEASPAYGSGHLRRMELLRLELAKRGIAAEIVAPTTIPITGLALAILDARDLDPRPFNSVARRVVALDNRHPCRVARLAQIDFYDTIPHPALPLGPTLRQALIDPQLFVDPPPERSRQVLIQLGPWPSLTLPVECGVADMELIFVDADRRLTPETFRRHLITAELVITYFGQTMLERWAVRRSPPALLLPAESPLHIELSRYLANALPEGALELIDSKRLARPAQLFAELLAAELPLTAALPDELVPAADGYARLCDRIVAELGGASRA